jgi:hypothetical protein
MDLHHPQRVARRKKRRKPQEQSPIFIDIAASEERFEAGVNAMFREIARDGATERG